ncbi:MAG: hypothetical protein ACRD2A_20805 [Vicinamibacterales bacterium]
MPELADTKEVRLTNGRRCRYRYENGVWRVAVYRMVREFDGKGRNPAFAYKWVEGMSTSPAFAVALAFDREQPTNADRQVASYIVERWSL